MTNETAPNNRPLVVERIGVLATMNGAGPGGLGLIEDAVVVCQGERVVACGRRDEIDKPADAFVIDARGQAVVPGLVDCHTHTLFLGERSDEFARRARGESYVQIAAAGGGIRSTMRLVRQASVEELVRAARPRLERMMERGVTTIEVKSGYGLSVEDELKMLWALRTLAHDVPVHLEPTLLAAHAVPPEESASSWITRIIDDLLPVVARERLASSCDIFVEHGAFDVDDARRLLQAASRAGLSLRLHAEQLSLLGGARLAAELCALSVGHLEYVTREDAAALAKANVVCEVLSLAQVFLRGQRPIPGRMLIDEGCIVAVATDLNPGTAMSCDLPLAAGLAVTQSGLTAEEALLGITRHGAAALGHTDRGVLAPGKRADLVVLQAAHPLALVYQWSLPLADVVVVGGRVVHRAASTSASR
jgi:imidazolonepropionase